MDIMVIAINGSDEKLAIQVQVYLMQMTHSIVSILLIVFGQSSIHIIGARQAGSLKAIWELSAAVNFIT